MEHVILSRERKKSGGYCIHFPHGYVKCDNHYFCDKCLIADRIRISKVRGNSEIPLFCDRDCLRQTKAGGGENFYRKPIVLTEAAMERLCIEKTLFNQMAFAYGGSGVFVQNKVGAVDCFLLSDKEKKFTIYRFEAYGIPNERAVEKWEKLFFMGLRGYFK